MSPGISLEGMMLKLKLQYFGHLMRSVDSLEKTLMLGRIGGRRRRGRQRMRWLDGITDWWTWVCVNSGSWWWTGRPGLLRFMGLQRVRHDWATELNWTELNWTESNTYFSILTKIFLLTDFSLYSYHHFFKNVNFHLFLCSVFYRFGVEALQFSLDLSLSILVLLLL